MMFAWYEFSFQKEESRGQEGTGTAPNGCRSDRQTRHQKRHLFLPPTPLRHNGHQGKIYVGVHCSLGRLSPLSQRRSQQPLSQPGSEFGHCWRSLKKGIRGGAHTGAGHSTRRKENLHFFSHGGQTRVAHGVRGRRASWLCTETPADGRFGVPVVGRGPSRRSTKSEKNERLGVTFCTMIAIEPCTL